MHVLTALAAVLQFGIGLIVSGTTNPPKVLGVLDLAESWDPSLAIVMGGAILAAAPSFRFASKRERSLLGASMRLPAATRIDHRLVLGSVAYGAGRAAAFHCRHARRDGHLRTIRTKQRAMQSGLQAMDQACPSKLQGGFSQTFRNQRGASYSLEPKRCS